MTREKKKNAWNVRSFIVLSSALMTFSHQKHINILVYIYVALIASEKLNDPSNSAYTHSLHMSLPTHAPFENSCSMLHAITILITKINIAIRVLKEFERKESRKRIIYTEIFVSFVSREEEK